MKMTRRQIEALFAVELKLIRREQVREFVISVMREHAASYFWTAPASLSRTRHPEIACRDHGLIIHTKLAIWWFCRLFRTAENFGFKDEAIAALLLHDIRKHNATLNPDGSPVELQIQSIGEPPKKKPRLVNHGEEVARIIIDEFYSHGEYWMWCIVMAIANHMGKWTKPFPTEMQPQTAGECRLVQYVHLSDYCAAQKMPAVCKILERMLEQITDILRDGKPIHFPPAPDDWGTIVSFLDDK